VFVEILFITWWQQQGWFPQMGNNKNRKSSKK
jgi:hypothetical protein